MLKNLQKNRKVQALFIYSLFFLLLGGAMTFIFASGGRSMIEKTDAVYQHYPALCYIRRYLRQAAKELLLHHRLVFPQVDYRIGQGMDVLTTLNYYGLGDPLTCISVFFPAKSMPDCYSLLLLLRIYLCGLFFLLYCFETGAGNYISTVAGAIAYCFGTYTLYAGFKHPLFLNGPLYLPLLLLGVERALRRKKYLFLSVATALCLITNFYFAYMNAIIVGSYILIRLFWMRKSSVRARLCWFVKLAAACVCGMGLSAVIFLPVVNAFLNNGRIGSTDGPEQPSFLYPLNYYKGILERFLIVTPDNPFWTCLGFSALFLPALVVLFVHKGKNQEEKQWMRPLRTGVILCGVLVCFPIVGKVMNGFSYVTNRWFFAGAFLAALTMVYVLPVMLKLTKREFVVTVVFSALCAGIVLLPGDAQDGAYRAAVAVCILAALLVSLAGSAGAWKNRVCRLPLAAVFLCLAAVSSWLHINEMYFSQDGTNIERYELLEDIDQFYKDTASKGMPLLKTTEDDTFYRVDREYAPANRSLMDGIKGHSYYYSMSPSGLSELYQALSLNDLQYRDMLMSQAGRTILDEITATKYYATTEAGIKWAPFGYSAVVHKNEKKRSGAVIMENEYFLPLGFTYSSWVGREEFDELAEEKRQQLLLQSVVLEKDAGGIEKTEPEALHYSITESEVTFRNTVEASYENQKLQVSENGAMVELDFEAPAKSEVYLVLKGIRSDKEQKHKFYVLQDGFRERVTGLSPKFIYWFGHDYMMVNLGYSEEPRTGCTLKFKGGWSASIDEIKVISYGMENYPEQVKALGEDVLEKIEVKDNCISGEIALDEEKLLYISIPYSRGWSAYVDGKKTEILKANLAYMAIIPGKGTHEVVFRYETPCLRLGIAISALSLLVIILFQVFGRRRFGTGKTGRKERSYK